MSRGDGLFRRAGSLLGPHGRPPSLRAEHIRSSLIYLLAALPGGHSR